MNISTTNEIVKIKIYLRSVKFVSYCMLWVGSDTSHADSILGFRKHGVDLAILFLSVVEQDSLRVNFVSCMHTQIYAESWCWNFSSTNTQISFLMQWDCIRETGLILGNREAEMTLSMNVVQTSRKKKRLLYAKVHLSPETYKVCQKSKYDTTDRFPECERRLPRRTRWWVLNRSLN